MKAGLAEDNLHCNGWDVMDGWRAVLCEKCGAPQAYLKLACVVALTLSLNFFFLATTLRLVMRWWLLLCFGFFFLKKIRFLFVYFFCFAD